jgi:hypothetical protein
MNERMVARARMAATSRAHRWSRGWCLAASAALQRVTLALSAFADGICSHIQVRAHAAAAAAHTQPLTSAWPPALLPHMSRTCHTHVTHMSHSVVTRHSPHITVTACTQPYAELFGLRCGIPPVHILNFSEEVVRDQALFVGSLLAAELEPRLRHAAGASSWQVRRGGCGCACARASRACGQAVVPTTTHEPHAATRRGTTRGDTAPLCAPAPHTHTHNPHRW